MFRTRLLLLYPSFPPASCVQCPSHHPSRWRVLACIVPLYPFKYLCQLQIFCSSIWLQTPSLHPVSPGMRHSVVLQKFAEILEEFIVHFFHILTLYYLCYLRIFCSAIWFQNYYQKSTFFWYLTPCCLVEFADISEEGNASIFTSSD
jgi:hypothetical protein